MGSCPKWCKRTCNGEVCLYISWPLITLLNRASSVFTLLPDIHSLLSCSLFVKGSHRGGTKNMIHLLCIPWQQTCKAGHDSGHLHLQLEAIMSGWVHGQGEIWTGRETGRGLAFHAISNFTTWDLELRMKEQHFLLPDSPFPAGIVILHVQILHFECVSLGFSKTFFWGSGGDC